MLLTGKRIKDERQMLAIGAKWERMNWFVRPGRYLIDYRNNERQFPRHEEPSAVHSAPGRPRQAINTVACVFFLLQTGLVNEREMDVWIEAVMAPFLLILPLLASLRYLIQPIGKRCSSSASVRRKKCIAKKRASHAAWIPRRLSESPLGSTPRFIDLSR